MEEILLLTWMKAIQSIFALSLLLMQNKNSFNDGGQERKTMQMMCEGMIHHFDHNSDEQWLNLTYQTLLI